MTKPDPLRPPVHAMGGKGRAMQEWWWKGMSRRRRKRRRKSFNRVGGVPIDGR